MINPYIIGPYKDTDSSKFWGRTTEIEGMYKSFMQNDYLVCYADSGEGKSSILNAGLFNKLKENRYYPINIRFKFDDGVASLDFDSIINEIINNVIHNTEGMVWEISDFVYNITDDYEDEDFNALRQTGLIEKYVWLRLRYSNIVINNIKYVPVLVFDQFEEVFTNPKSEIWTKEFFHWLEELSTDICPDKILKEIKTCIEDDFLLISSEKRFKAIFSLRSEYVGNVDYWGLQHCYIPDLKNNRYFLKPLTPQGARAVIKQPLGFPNMSDSDCESLIVGCSGNDEYVKAGMPCVPASILSIICHELFELQESERKALLTRLNNDRNNVVEGVLENYYINTLKSCGIKDEKTRDILENTLVDDKGNRKRVSTRHKDFSALSSEQINKLIEVNILRIISIVKNDNDSEPEYIVELPHDRFCGFIMNHKNKRLAELQSRNNSLKEWLLFGVLCAILGASAWYIHNVFIDTLVPFLGKIIIHINDISFKNEPDDNIDKETIRQIIDFAKVFCQEFGFKELKVTACVLLSALLVPCAIVWFAKGWKKGAVTLSSCGVLISTWLLIKTQLGIIDGDIGSFAFVSISILLGLLGYIAVKWKNITISETSLWPFWGSWFLFFSFLFWEFLRSLKIGYSNPSDSLCFVILLPALLLAWTLTYFKIEVPSIKFIQGKWRTFIQICIILGLTAILAFNNTFRFLDVFGIYAILILTILGLIYILWNIKSASKRVVAITINVVALIAIYILNLGYNPLVVNYKDINGVYSWRLVTVEDSTKTLEGFCDPIDGKTIAPCVFSPGGKIKSSKFTENPIIGGKSSNLDNSFKWEDGVAEGVIRYTPTVEEHIRRINEDTSSLSAQMDYYSPQLYQEIRNMCLEYIVEAKPYTLDDFKTLDKLDSLQHIALQEELKSWDINKKDSLVRNSKVYVRDRIDVIVDDDIYKLLSIITKNLYIYVLKDKIVQKQFPEIFTLLNYYYILYFHSVPGMDTNFNLNSNVSIRTDSSSFSTSDSILVNDDDIINLKCYAWYHLFRSLITTDINSYAQKIQDAVQYSTTTIDAIIAEMSKSDFSSKVLLGNFFKSLDGNLGIQSLTKIMEDYENAKNQTLSPLSEALLSLESIKTIQNETGFDRFSREVLDTLLPILENKPNNIYYSTLKDICEYLLISRTFRGYDIETEHKRLTKVNEIKSGFYNSTMEMDSSLQESTSRFVEVLDLANKLFK